MKKRTPSNFRLFVVVVIGFVCTCSVLLMVNYVFFGFNLPFSVTNQRIQPTLVVREEVDDLLIISFPENELVIEMVRVPSGMYWRGNNGGSDKSKFPQEIYLDEFWIDRYEVTNEQFAAFVAQTGYKTVVEKEETGRSQLGWGQREPGVTWQNPQGSNSNIDNLPDHPVVQVAWFDAVAYCQWREARLPTEAEWEKAAYGVNGSLYPWGNNFDGGKLNYCDVNCIELFKDGAFDDQYLGTTPVGSYQNGASYFGAFDMAGNVNEWVSDWYSDDSYSDSSYINPQGPKDEEVPNATLLNHMNSGAKVIRGGSWREPNKFASSNIRNSNPPVLGGDDLGFRCVYSSHDFRPAGK